jgi:hypothetical protein
MKQLCALNAECATGHPGCSANYVAIGERWIEFEVTCGYHSYPSTGAFEQIKGGQVSADPAGATPGGNQIPRPQLADPHATARSRPPAHLPDPAHSHTSEDEDAAAIIPPST